MAALPLRLVPPWRFVMRPIPRQSTEALEASSSTSHYVRRMRIPQYRWRNIKKQAYQRSTDTPIDFDLYRRLIPQPFHYCGVPHVENRRNDVDRHGTIEGQPCVVLHDLKLHTASRVCPRYSCVRRGD